MIIIEDSIVVQQQVGLVLFVVTGMHVKSVSIKIGIQVTVPSPGSIRVRIMSGTGTVVYSWNIRL